MGTSDRCGAGGIWEAEAHGTAGWKNGQPRVRARFVDYNGMADNDQTFVQVKFYKHRSWVCGINGLPLPAGALNSGPPVLSPDRLSR